MSTETSIQPLDIYTSFREDGVDRFSALIPDGSGMVP
jgi:hypothetical protein